LDLRGRQNLYGIDSRARLFEAGFHAAFPPYASSAASPASPPTPSLGIAFLVAVNFLAFASTILADEIRLVRLYFIASLRRGRRSLRGGFLFVSAPPPPPTAAPAVPLPAFLLCVRSLHSLVDLLLLFVVRDQGLS
jgi:hypothetical protein